MQKLKQFLKHFLLINDTPHKIAGGAALGVFLGIIPGEGVTAALILASLFRLNRLAASAGALATNMWTTVIVLPVAALVGGWLFGIAPAQLTSEFHQTYDSGLKYFLGKTVFFNLALPLLTGFVLVAGITALLCYFAVYGFLHFKRTDQQHLFKE